MINKVKEIHDFIISRGGRAASMPMPESLPEERITEMVNGVLVTRPVKKVTNLNKTKTKSTPTAAESEPQITTLNDSWERQQESKAAATSVQGINKIREIHDFINSNRRRY